MRKLVGAICIVGTWVGPVHAEEELAPVADIAVLNVRSDAGDASLGVKAPQILVRSDVSGDTISLTAGTSVDSWEHFAKTNFSLTLNAPFNKKKKLGNFLTETGLPGTASVGFNLSISLLADRVESVRQERDKYLDSEVSQINLVQAVYQRCLQANIAKPQDCQGKDSRELAEKYASDELRAQLVQGFATKEAKLLAAPYLSVQFFGSVGRETYEFRDALSFSEGDRKKSLYSFGTSVAYLPRLDSPVGWFAGAEHKRAYKLPDAETRCPIATAGATSVTCFNAAFGPPVADNSASVFGAARLNGELLNQLPFSAELKFAYDVKDNEWGVTLPIYFLRNKDGDLNGGVRVGWDSETDKFLFGVFVGSAFDFLKL
jgi:hypothetical protein